MSKLKLALWLIAHILVFSTNIHLIVMHTTGTLTACLGFLLGVLQCIFLTELFEEYEKRRKYEDCK
jgi:hypothetical protein